MFLKNKQGFQQNKHVNVTGFQKQSKHVDVPGFQQNKHVNVPGFLRKTKGSFKKKHVNVRGFQKGF